MKILSSVVYSDLVSLAGRTRRPQRKLKRHGRAIKRLTTPSTGPAVDGGNIDII